MELHDICDGCSRHPAVCMCSVSISSEGAVVSRPQPAKMSDKLRIIAIDARFKEHQTKAQSLTEQVKFMAHEAAKQGKLSLHLWCGSLNISKEAAEMVSRELARDGFKCTITKEITAWHSNTDWDEEELLFVSWE